MRRFNQALLVLIAVLCGLRAVLYVITPYWTIPPPFEAYHLEAKMVHLAWRFQAGVRPYPPWQNGPYVANFFGPCYFALVGLIGWATDASLDGLTHIGRSISFGSGLLTSAVIAFWVGRRAGLGAALAAAAASLGSLPMYGFTYMARPDTMAEFLGLVGFFLSRLQARSAFGAGWIALLLAIATKQTSGLFLVAAGLALLVDGRRRRALIVLVGGPAVLGALALAVNATIEPNFLASLLGESRTPTDLSTWLDTLRRLLIGAPDLGFFSVVGLVLWTVRKPRDVGSTVLALVIIVGNTAAALKRGADLNYYLNLRIIEALAVGSLWQAAAAPSGRGRLAIALTAAWGVLFILPGVGGAFVQINGIWGIFDQIRSPQGRALAHSYAIAIRLAEDPKVRLLTDVGPVDLHRRERAVFADPWLFRMHVETGQIQPTEMMDRIKSQDYDTIITRQDLFSPGYESYHFNLPPAFVAPARMSYAPISIQPGLFFYERSRFRTRSPVGGGSP